MITGSNISIIHVKPYPKIIMQEYCFLDYSIPLQNQKEPHTHTHRENQIFYVNLLNVQSTTVIYPVDNKLSIV